MLHWYSLLSGREFQILTITWLHFWPHIIDVWHLPSVYVACKGLSDLGNGPNKPTATIFCEYNASLQDAALVFTLVRARISDSDNNLAAFLTTHHWCLASSSVYVACKGFSALGNGPNKPTATIFCEYNASLQTSAASCNEALYSQKIVAVSLLGPLPRSDNPLQATYTLRRCQTSMICGQKCS